MANDKDWEQDMPGHEYFNSLEFELKSFLYNKLNSGELYKKKYKRNNTFFALPYDKNNTNNTNKRRRIN